MLCSTMSRLSGTHKVEMQRNRSPEEKLAVREIYQRELSHAKQKFYEKYVGLHKYPKRIIKQFDVLRYLGEGRCGVVFLANEIKTGISAAVKVVRKQNAIKSRSVARIVEEKKILHACSCDFIVRLLYVGEDFVNVYFFLELASGGDIDNLAPCPEPVAKHFVAQIALALEYLHTCHVIHRDVKEANVLLFSKTRVKLGDFGCAAKVPEGDSLYEIIGNPPYMAPEIIEANGYGVSPDWWSLGVMLYHLLFNRYPFDELVNDCEEALMFPEDTPISAEAKDIIRNLLKSDSFERLGLLRDGESTIKQHVWFKDLDFADVIDGWREVNFLERRFEVTAKPLERTDVFRWDERFNFYTGEYKDS